MKMQSITAVAAATLIAFGVATPAQAGSTTVPGLIHLWSGDGDANDGVGGAHGTLGTTTAFGTGRFRQAFSFDGQQSSVIDPLPVNINPSVLPQMTMGMWVNMSGVPNARGWVIGHDNGSYDRSLNLTDSRYDYGVAGGTGRTPHASSLIQLRDDLDTWYCVAVSYDGSAQTATFYADGSTQTVFAAPGWGDDTATLGGLRNYPNHTVDALVDEVFMFDRVLTTAELDRVCAELTLLAIGIDIKPGSFPNSINLGSGGATPVAILGSPELDVNDIDPDSLTLGTAGIKTVGKAGRFLCSVEDVSGDFSDVIFGLEGLPDGIDDLVCHFVTMQMVHEEGDTEATLAGALFDGTRIEGTDSVNIVP